MLKSLDEHSEIIEAIRSGDAGQADPGIEATRHDPRRAFQRSPCSHGTRYMSHKTLLIDVFETVVDWRSGIIRDLAEHFEGSLAVIGRRQWPISGVRNIDRRWS